MDYVYIARRISNGVHNYRLQVLTHQYFVIHSNDDFTVHTFICKSHASIQQI